MTLDKNVIMTIWTFLTKRDMKMTVSLAIVSLAAATVSVEAASMFKFTLLADGIN